MMPITHFAVSLVLSAWLFKYYSYAAFMVLIGGVFIDIDHYLVYVIPKRDMHFLRAYRHFKDYGRNGLHQWIKQELYAFHNLEMLALLAIFSFYSTLVFMFFIGVLVHYIMDWIAEYKAIGTVKSLSAFAWLFRAVKRKKEAP